MIYEETRGVLKTFLEGVIRDAVTYTEHAKVCAFSLPQESLLTIPTEKDSHLPRCRLCPEASRPYSLWFRWLSGLGHGSSMSLMNFFLGWKMGVLLWDPDLLYGVYCIIRIWGFTWHD
jgi:hypothetical protein